MNEITVSVITITYNCVSSVSRTIESVLSQDYKNLEYIIVDGKSTDGTWEKIQSYREKLSSRFGEGNFMMNSEKDGGISDAFNKGIRLAKGEIILLLNAGDVFSSESVVSEAASDFSGNGKPGVLFYRVQVGEKSFIPVSSSESDQEKIWRTCQVPHQGAFVSRETYEKIGLYETKYRIRMDYDFFARCVNGSISHKYIPRKIAEYEIGGTSMQISNARRFYREGLEIMEKYGLEISFFDRIQPMIPDWFRNLVRKFIKR